MSTIVRILRTSELDLHIRKVVRHKGVLRLLHVLSVVGTTQGCVVMAPLVASSVARSVLRTGRVMVMGAIEPSLLQLLHQTELYIDELLQG